MAAGGQPPRPQFQVLTPQCLICQASAPQCLTSPRSAPSQRAISQELAPQCLTSQVNSTSPNSFQYRAPQCLTLQGPAGWTMPAQVSPSQRLTSQPGVSAARRDQGDRDQFGRVHGVAVHAAASHALPSASSSPTIGSIAPSPSRSVYACWEPRLASSEPRPVERRRAWLAGCASKVPRLTASTAARASTRPAPAPGWPASCRCAVRTSAALATSGRRDVLVSYSSAATPETTAAAWEVPV